MSIHSIDINYLLVHYEDMKTEQLQIRVSSELKANIRKRASAANMDMSEWVLAALFPPVAREFQHLCAAGWKHKFQASLWENPRLAGQQFAAVEWAISLKDGAEFNDDALRAGCVEVASDEKSMRGGF